MTQVLSKNNPPTLDVAIMLMARPASPEPPNLNKDKRSYIPLPLGSYLQKASSRTLIFGS